MKVIYNVGQAKTNFKNVVVAIGVFDGLHIGHQALIKKAVARAKAINGKVVVFTFFPHPVEVLSPRKYLPFISSLKERLNLIEDLGVSACFVIRFNKRFSRVKPEYFIKKYIVNNFQPKEIFVGDDFRFGKGRRGGVELFIEQGRKYGFLVNIVALVKGRGKKVGSTQIRNLISEGKVALVSRFLGRPFSISGKVIHGESRGELLGYPTANIYLTKEILPLNGVYAARVRLGNKRYSAVANVGVRPSFQKNINKVTIEVHIFNFHQNIYGCDLKVEFIKRIRDERKFDSAQKLIAQIKRDEQKAQRILTSG